MPRLRPTAEVPTSCRAHVFATRQVPLAKCADRIEGFLAMDGNGFIAAFVVVEAAHGRGVGSALLRQAKALRPVGLMLWCFAANALHVSLLA